MTKTQAASAASAPRTVHLAVFDSLADWEIGHLMARIASPRWQRAPGQFETRTVAETRAPVRTMGGLTVVPDLTFDQLDPSASAMLILPGGDVWDADPTANGAAIECARRFLHTGVPVAAICGATAGLARAGLLDERDHTSSAPEYLQYTGGAYAGSARYRLEPVVDDRGLITAGPTHPVEFARAALARLDVFTPEVLDAWYRLFGQDDPSAYGVLAQA